MNRKYYIFGAVFALLLSGLFSSCVVINAGDEELYDFKFINDHILECNYSGYVSESDIEYVEVYDNRGCRKYYASVSVSSSSRDSRVTFVLNNRNLQNGWYVKIKFSGIFSDQIYKVTYYQ